MLHLAIHRPSGNATRARILDAVRRHPGINKNQLRKKLGIAWTTTSYHLRILARQGAVNVDRSPRDVRCYAPDVLPRYKSWMAALLNPVRVRILDELKSGEVAFGDLLKRLDADEDNLRRILREMTEEKVIRKRGSHRPRYSLHPDLPTSRAE